MNFIQTLSILEKLGVTINTVYWPPEYLSDNEYLAIQIKHQTSPKFCKENLALIVLCENNTAFKNRVYQVKKDEWLSKKNFHNIALDCFNILNSIDNVEPWQVALKEIFQNML